MESPFIPSFLAVSALSFVATLLCAAALFVVLRKRSRNVVALSSGQPSRWL